jgi:outer membrane lipoprotein-sorting protein
MPVSKRFGICLRGGGVVVSLLSIPHPAFGLSGPAIADSVKQRFTRAKTIFVQYRQEIRQRGFTTAEKIAGKIWLAGEKKFRIENPEQTVVSDGESLWSYAPRLKQVTIQKTAKAKNLVLPKDFLFSFFTEYGIATGGEETVAGKRCYRLTLKSLKPDVLIPAMTVWVEQGSFFTRKVAYTDANDTQVTFRFPIIRTGGTVPGSRFTFAAPQGVEVVTLP